MQRKGVDISVWQKGVDYQALKDAGAEYVIIRAGHGEAVDKEFEHHVEGCISVGLPYGYYWFSYASDERQARREAAACIKAISQYPRPQYPVFFDAEDEDVAKALGREQMTNVALAFVEAIEDGGYPSGVYANPNWMEKEYNKQRLIENTDIWLAHWTWNPDKKSKYDYKQTIWQWGTINVKGVTVDADLCYADYPAITEQWYKDRSKKTVEQLAAEVLNGSWGNGVERVARLGGAGYDAKAVQDEVNRILAKRAQKPLDEIVVEVVRGVWGNGDERKQRLIAAGYDYDEVKDAVNARLAG